MRTFDLLRQEGTWEEFLALKSAKGRLTRTEEEELRQFIARKAYLPILDDLENGRPLPHPVIREINKSGTDKKRTVFTFPQDHNLFFKMIAHQLQRYDGLFEDNLFSFRTCLGVRGAVSMVLGQVDLASAYAYKADIRDYFNSVDPGTVLPMVREALQDDPPLANLLAAALTDPFALKDGQPVAVRKGIMAGVPFSGFLADLFLTGLDRRFAVRCIPYVRYSDDIIVFAKSREEIEHCRDVIREALKERGLAVNEKKEFLYPPGSGVEFLGFLLSPEEVDISAVSQMKLKRKLKRKAGALYRWRIRKGLGGRQAARAFIKYLNRKFYGEAVKGELTWTRWYFPVITTDRTLRIIDRYAVSLIRYLYTGRYGKQNYDLRYGEIVSLGFRSLVNAYWKTREQ